MRPLAEAVRRRAHRSLSQRLVRCVSSTEEPTIPEQFDMTQPGKVTPPVYIDGVPQSFDPKVSALVGWLVGCMLFVLCLSVCVRATRVKWAGKYPIQVQWIDAVLLFARHCSRSASINFAWHLMYHMSLLSRWKRWWTKLGP